MPRFLNTLGKKLILPLLLGYACLLRAQHATDYHFAHLDFNRGLSHNQVNCIYKGQKGFMWFGTMSGLNRYDGYRFKTFHHAIKDTTSLNDDYIMRIVTGPYDKIWVQSRTGFNIYDPETEKFNRCPNLTLQKWGIPGYGLSDIVKTGKGYWFVYPDSGIYFFSYNKPVIALMRNRALGADAIADVKCDSKNNGWIIHTNGLIEEVDAATQKVILQYNGLLQKTGKEKIAYQLYIDAQDVLWVYGVGFGNGLYCINVPANTLQQYAANGKQPLLSSNIVQSVVQDDRGLIWIATDHGGLNILDKTTGSVRVLMNKPGDETSISQNSLLSLYKDDLGIVWAGTYKQGINYYHEGVVKFPLYHHQEADAFGLPYNDVNRFVEDAKGNIWIGTNGGGLIYFDRSNHTFKQFKHNPSNANSLTNDVIVSLCIDHNNTLWIGTYFGGLDSYDGKTFTHHRHNPNDSTSLADDRVWEIYEDRSYNLWIGTLEAGLERYDAKSNRFDHFKPNVPNSVHAGYISAITEDREGNVWIGTAYGIDVKHKNKAGFTQLLSPATGLSNENVLSVFCDRRGFIWVGTRDGLNVYDAQSNHFQAFYKEDGLPDNAILNIVEDDLQHLWVSTSNGIGRITYTGTLKEGLRINCINYDPVDGLQGKEFNENAALKTREGEIMFGGANGFNLFNPAHLMINPHVPPVVLTGLQIFNRDISSVQTNGKGVVLQKAISETDCITLQYNENIFSIEFSALSYINTQKNKYAYKLQGFNDQWLYTNGDARKVTYTNLDPGKYTFYVKASNADGVWNEQGIAVSIVVLPPLWKTPVAYGVYVLLAVIIIFLARRYTIQHAHMRFALEQERKEAQRRQELDRMKIRFFTNVSHEFRTPLSLIITPLEKMIRSTNEPAQQLQYQLIQRNARRLLNLVNQLLDFRKMEVQELKLHATEGDIVQFIKETSYSFTDIAEKKHIQFAYTADLESLYAIFDHDKLERIIFNLLSNAFKFTPEKGSVTVAVNATQKEGDTLLEIKVKDTGIGIPADRQEQIFGRFFQHDVPGDMLNQGSGIGLAITREFVHLMHGEVVVESAEFKGSCFTVRLPVTEISPSAATKEQAVAREVAAIEPGIITHSNKPATGKKQYTVLLVEDNEDFLFYLKDNLQEYYHIVEASNGREGWQKTLSTHPDIVVSDINMPGINGIDLCQKIKQDARTRHIPVVLLTAVTGEEQQLRSIETGAADYMTKPFNFEILLSRIKNLLHQQQSLRQSFAKQVAIKASDIPVESPDEKFVQDALVIVEKNISNADFSVEDLSRALLLSRAAVYKRIFVLTGKTPTEFIRSVRLERASQLLQKTKKTVAEVAYETGFNNPKYFSKYFKARFGVLPSAYQAAAKKG